MAMPDDTIAAIATPAGKGGIGVVRVSGSSVLSIARALLGKVPIPRRAHFSVFKDHAGQPIDEGIALYFKAPHSFTGEDVLELQGHGGPVVLNSLLEAVLLAGARLARPGEFSERAFLNGKMDLAQAEAVVDLINASSQQAARNALHSLQGEFSHHIHRLKDQLIQLRVYIEASLDFSTEEIDFLANEDLRIQLQHCLAYLEHLFSTARTGSLLREGARVVIAGKPNVGKSSLLNRLTETETAIVSETPGTTRDVLKEWIHLDGIPLHLIDTAGLRESLDPIEQEGIKRGKTAMTQADLILLVLDPRLISSDKTFLEEERFLLSLSIPVLLVFNKIDLLNSPKQLLDGRVEDQTYPSVSVSALTGEGLENLKKTLKNMLGYYESSETGFTARTRHLKALAQTRNHLLSAEKHLTSEQAGELLAEDLKYAQQSLDEITGEFTPDDLLGEIFSHFCIGK